MDISVKRIKNYITTRDPQPSPIQGWTSHQGEEFTTDEEIIKWLPHSMFASGSCCTDSAVWVVASNFTGNFLPPYKLLEMYVESDQPFCGPFIKQCNTQRPFCAAQ